MYVSIDMILGFDSPLDCMQQVNTTRPHTSAAEVSKPQRRTVGDQDVGVTRDLVPLLKTFFSSF